MVHTEPVIVVVACADTQTSRIVSGAVRENRHTFPVAGFEVVLVVARAAEFIASCLIVVDASVAKLVVVRVRF